MQLIDRQTLKRYMDHRGESTRSLARKVGCSHSVIGHLLSGERATCQPKNARGIERALDAPPGSLFDAKVVVPRVSTVRMDGEVA